MQVDSSQIQRFVPMNQNIPEEGDEALRLTLDFSAQQTYDLDLTLFVQQKKISMIQGVFIDAADTGVPVKVTVGNPSGQRIIAKQQTQGYYPLLAPNPPSFRFEAATGVVNFYFYNAPISPVVWPTV